MSTGLRISNVFARNLFISTRTGTVTSTTAGIFPDTLARYVALHFLFGCCFRYSAYLDVLVLPGKSTLAPVVLQKYSLFLLTCSCCFPSFVFYLLTLLSMNCVFYHFQKGRVANVFPMSETNT